MSFEKKDYAIILGAFALLLIVSTVSMVLGLSIRVEAVVDMASALIIFSSLYFVKKGIDLAGGTVGRAMSIVAVGVGYYGLYILPHIYYHITDPEMIGPLPAVPVEIFLHTSTTMVFFVIAWGFYRLYEGGKE
jgi:hypothetical protein